MEKVFRCFAEKKPGFDIEARALLPELKSDLDLPAVSGLRLLNRYDVMGISDSDYERAKNIVFSEPPCDVCHDENLSLEGVCRVLAVEPLPGQYDQRADSCAQCIQLLTNENRPLVRAARIYLFYGEISGADFEKIKNYLINPVECREASLEKPLSLKQDYPAPADVPVVSGFNALTPDELFAFISRYSLAMDRDDLAFMQNYFKNTENREPTLTELRVIDTYWSDHCRHTTFLTELTDIKIDDADVSSAFSLYQAGRDELSDGSGKIRPVSLMDMATSAARLLRRRGLLKNLDESEEINACSVKVTAKVGGRDEDWLLMFKNETHNHPTEIEPFGGAATCLGGAIRDPLSGRAFVYQAMRVSGASDPRAPVSETLPGKLSQRKICRTAAAGYSCYGNQIGLATGLVREYYHPGYVAKRLEVGAVVGAAPACAVVRQTPEPGDLVILLGGKTGRDGCGGATGSSKIHTGESLESCGAEVQKGNPPEERKIQRLFRNSSVTRLIKRCNDFGAGGAAVSIGELADGLHIVLDRIPKKYEGLDGTELAISESQERMSVVVSKDDAEKFIEYAAAENLEATVVARVTENPRLVMEFSGVTLVDLSRDFLGSNGAPKKVRAEVGALPLPSLLPELSGETAKKRLLNHLSSLNICSGRGLSERFDGSIGAASVVMPFGGKTGLSPAPVMAAKLPVLTGDTTTTSVMAHGFDPFLSEQNPFAGASMAVVESLSKLLASGCRLEDAYLTFQEYFERLRGEPGRYGKPVSALLGAYTAQLGLSVAAIGGKDSMSGSFEDFDVPPTLISFAVATCEISDIVTPEFKKPGSFIYLFAAPTKPGGLPDYPAVKAVWGRVTDLMKSGDVLSAQALGIGGAAECVFKMAIGNLVGVRFEDNITDSIFYSKNYGGIIVETSSETDAFLLGRTVPESEFLLNGEKIDLWELIRGFEAPLSAVYPVTAAAPGGAAPEISCVKRSAAAPAVKTARPLAVIPVFPGTNCEYDTARALERAGAASEIVIIRNLSREALRDSAIALSDAVGRAQMLVIPGGFSGGDEPDGSGKFIASFLRNPAISDAISSLLYLRGGLALGICNGFQALIKLGLVPFGEIRDLDEGCPTLTFNAIGRHQSRYVRTRVASVMSPWLSKLQIGDIHTVAVSHGEGRFVATGDMLKSLAANAQIAFQYADDQGRPSMDISFNPNGSAWAVEGISSPDGRVLGKMAHTERYSPGIAKNIYGEKFQPLFEGGVSYFK